MNLKALITTLVLGSSSVAAADPVFTAQARASWSFGTHRAPVVRDHRVRDLPPPRADLYRGGYDHTYRGGGYEDTSRFPQNVKLNSDSSEYIGPMFSTRYGGWSVLTEPTRIELSRQIIRTSGFFRGLMLESVRGSSFVKMVKVQLANGEQQTITINRTLSGASSINLPIRGEIEYIVVYGTTNQGSSYRVLGA